MSGGIASLVTQVHEDDAKSTPAPPASQPQKAKPVVETKPRSCWWQVFCCGCCCKSTVEDRPPIENEPAKQPTPGPTPVQGGQGPEVKIEQPKPAPEQQVVTPPEPEPVPEPPREEPQWLLDPLPEEDKKANRKTLVLDLDETLVHSSFTYIPDADFIIEIELDGAIYKVYVRKRPGVDEFMREVGKKFEVVVFTASLAKYADPLLDILDKDKVVTKRLFREACVQHYGNYVKDLSRLGRRLEHSIIIDNSPFSYMFQPDNAIPITSWFNDKSDRQLLELLPFLDSLLEIDDVSTALAQKSA